MEVKLALLADGANVSREGKLNLLGIFDTLFARSFPTTHPQMQLVIRFEAAAREAGSTRQVEVQLVAGDGSILFRLPGALTVQPHGLGDAIRMDHVLTLNHVQFERPGRYRSDVLVDAGVAAAVPLQVEETAAGGDDARDAREPCPGRGRRSGAGLRTRDRATGTTSQRR